MAGPDPVRAFVILALLFGTAFALTTPPLAAPDEGRHLARIYTLSEGAVWVPGAGGAPPATVPASVVRLHREVQRLWPTRRSLRRTPGEAAALLRIPLAPERRAPVHHLAGYPPLAYAPQAVGVAVGRTLGVGPAGLVLLGRLANLAAWVAAVAFALRMAPLRRWPLACLALLPMAVFLAGSLSGDPPTFAAAAVLVAAVWRVAFGPGGRAAPRDVAVLLASALALSLTKPGYAVVAGIVLVVPRERFARPGAWLGLVIATLALAAGPSLAWMLAMRTAEAFTPAGGPDAAAQLQGMLGNPGRFAAVLGHTLREVGFDLVRSFVGHLGRLEVRVPVSLVAAGLAVPLVLAVCDGRDPARLTAWRRIAHGALLVLGALLIFVLAYLGANDVGAPVIRGVQGRYFLPLAPLALAAIPAWLPRPGPAAGAATAAYLALSLAFSWVLLARHFYSF